MIPARSGKTVEYEHVWGLRLNVWTSIVLFVLAAVAYVVSLRRHPGRQDDVYLPGRAPDGHPGTGPVVAELAADLIEYLARAQCRAAGLELPSSSVFAHRPSKLDFAWADLSFFTKALKRVNTLYEKDATQRAGFMERTRLLFQLKYRRNYPAVASPEALDAEMDKVFARLLAILHEVQETDLGMSLETSNTFSEGFLNLLRVATTLNGIVLGQLEGERPHLAPYFQTLVMFVVKYFERDPSQNFWSLDETLAAHAVPLLEALAAADGAAAADSHPTVA